MINESSKRLDLVKDFNVGGVSLWELGQVIFKFWVVLTVIGIRLLLRTAVKVPIWDDADGGNLTTIMCTGRCS